MAKHYAATSLTGGGSGALDKINGSLLSDGDTARVTIKATGRTYFFHLDATSGATESSPDVIAPDTSADSKRWILSKVEVDASTLGTSAPNDMATESEATTGTATDKVMSPATSRAAFDSWVGGKTSVPRQAILTGKVDSDGLPAFLAVSGNDVQIVATADDPLLMSFSAGFGSQGPVDYFEQIVSTFAAWANAGFILGVRNYLYAQREPDGSITYGVTDIPPEYSHKRGGVDIIAIAPHTTAIGAYGTASASGNQASSEPWRAVDRVASTQFYHTTSTPAGYWRYVMPNQRFVCGVAITAPASVSSAPKDFTIKIGVATDTPDVTIISPATQGAWTVGERREFLFSAPTLIKSLEHNNTTTIGGAGVAFGFAEFELLFCDDFFDLNTYTMRSPDGTQRHRLYLGHVDVDAGGVLSGLYCYALGTYCIRTVNGGTNIAVNTRYVELNPFGFGVPVESLAEVKVSGEWGDSGQFYTSATVASGVRAAVFAGGIVVRTNEASLVWASGNGPLHPWPALSSAVTSAPARIIVQRAF